jgi:hypothetical protein
MTSPFKRRGKRTRQRTEKKERKKKREPWEMRSNECLSFFGNPMHLTHRDVHDAE